MKKSILSLALFAGLASGQANAALMIDNLSITSSQVSFDLTGTVDVVGSADLDSLFFGFVGSDSWMTANPVSASGFSSNGGTYDFSSVGGANSNTWGDYLYTNGIDTLVLGDVVDLSYSIAGTFNTIGLNIWDFKVQAGYDGTTNDFIQPALIAGGVASVASVPEPFSLSLLGLGLAGLGLSRKRKAL